MSTSITHLWRLVRWGRTLARHGALNGIERDPLTPPRVRLLCRVARFGARVPKQPAYADAFQALGPARSEEHTSELQSIMRNSYAVFFLTNKNINQQQSIHS